MRCLLVSFLILFNASAFAEPIGLIDVLEDNSLLINMSEKEQRAIFGELLGENFLYINSPVLEKFLAKALSDYILSESFKRIKTVYSTPYVYFGSLLYGHLKKTNPDRLINTIFNRAVFLALKQYDSENDLKMPFYIREFLNKVNELTPNRREALGILYAKYSLEVEKSKDLPESIFTGIKEYLKQKGLENISKEDLANEYLKQLLLDFHSEDQAVCNRALLMWYSDETKILFNNLAIVSGNTAYVDIYNASKTEPNFKQLKYIVRLTLLSGRR